MGEIRTREYKLFQQEKENRAKVVGIYEKLAKFSGKLIKLSPDKKTKSKLDDSIEFVGMNVSPKDAMSLAVLSFFLIFLVIGTLALFQLLSITLVLILLLLTPLLSIFLLYYPVVSERRMRMKIGSDMVVMFLYIAISLRQKPNLERAVKFAAENIEGPLSWQLRKLLWDVELRKYQSVSEAIQEYSDKYWSDQGKEVTEAFNLTITALSSSKKRREDLLDEAVNLILQGTKERAKHYAQDLQLPVTLVNTLGILLPIVALVLLPILFIFLGEAVNPVSLIILYNVMLPAGLYLGIKYILLKRPWTFSVPSIEGYPGQVEKGKVKLFGFSIPVIIPTLLFAIPVFITGLLLTVRADVFTLGRLFYSIIAISGISMGISIYFLLNTVKKKEISEKIANTEKEFASALFEIGSKLYEGTPLEVSLEKGVKSIEDSDISGFFKIMLRNVREFGMTLEKAVFDPRQGAINEYPSDLIESIMKIVVEMSKRGVKSTAMTMMVISKYLKNMHQTEEDMRDMLSETTSSLNFQAWGLAPLTSGIVVSLSAAMMRILQQMEEIFGSLSGYLDTTGGGQAGVSGTTLSPFVALDKIIPPEGFQFIVGTYLIEIIVIISMFYISLTKGENWIERQQHTGQIMILGFIIYTAVAVILYALFITMIPPLAGIVG